MSTQTQTHPNLIQTIHALAPEEHPAEELGSPPPQSTLPHSTAR
jgi:hypothetical protein